MTNLASQHQELADSCSPSPDLKFAIKVENLSKVYKLYNSHVDRLKEALHPLRRHYHHEFYALNDVSFEIKKGESVGIIGKNGSGKSTLLKILTGVLTPTSGRVTVDGKVSALLELGAGFNPELSGLENVFFNGMLMGYTREEMEARLDDILSFADIGEFVHQPVKIYSSGMFVRLAFAVAVNVEPEILIVDEALSVGDMRFQRKCFAKIESFRENNNTILFVSHDVSTIGNICSNAMLLDSGKLLTRDEPRIVSKLYIQMLYGENLAQTISDVAQQQGSGDETAYSEAKVRAINRIGQLSKPSTSELRHGNGKAEIIDFGIFDENKSRVNRLISGDKYIFFFYVLFKENIEKLFVSFLIRDAQGVNLFITNTDIIKIKIPEQKSGEVLYVTSNITMHLATGEYFMSCVTLDNMSSEYLDRRLDVYHFNVASTDLKCKGYVNLNPVLKCQQFSYD